jgi:ribosomal protein L37AE/L43A
MKDYKEQKCPICGREAVSEEMVLDKNGVWLCNECYNDAFDDDGHYIPPYELDEIQDAYDDEDFDEEYYTSNRCPSCGKKITRHEEELYDGECVDCFTRKHGR